MNDYNREMNKIVYETAGKKPRLVLHCCCAPCSGSVLERLAPCFAITLFYYNPNIDTKEEYNKRLDALRTLNEKGGYRFPLFAAPYDHSQFVSAAEGLYAAPEGGERCERCISLRLEETAAFAENGGFEYFCTTLSVSPHKNAEIINSLGRKLSKRRNSSFLPSDFKKKGGFLRSNEICRQYALYRQNYCGCEFAKQISK